MHIYEYIYDICIYMIYAEENKSHSMLTYETSHAALLQIYLKACRLIMHMTDEFISTKHTNIL